MPKQNKICRVCGASYEACKSIKTGDSVFNWREVACSPECGEVYLQKVIAARSKEIAPAVPHKKKRAKAEEAAEAEVLNMESAQVDPEALPKEHASEE